MSRDDVVLPGSQRKRADHSPGEGPSGPIVRNAVRFSRMASVSLRGINPAFIRRPTQGHSRRNPVFSFWGLIHTPSGPAFAGKQTQGHSRRNPVFSFWGLIDTPSGPAFAGRQTRGHSRRNPVFSFWGLIDTPSGPAFAGRQTRGHSRRNPVFSFWGLCPLPRRALSEDGGLSSHREPAPPFFPAKSVYQGGEKKANHFCLRRPPRA